MSEGQFYLLGFYLIPLVILLLGCLLVLSESAAWSDKRDAARVMWLSPLWPLLLVFVAVLGLRRLWREADWKNLMRDVRRM